MEKYGKVFKILREAKKMSLKEVARDFVTPAQLSRFENGKSNLSVDTFFNCLKRMDVLQGEFSTFYSLYYQDEDVRISRELNKAIGRRDVAYLKRLIQEYTEKFESEGRKSDRVLIAVFYTIMNRCDSSHIIPEVEKEVISDYLMSIDEWCFYEIWILGYCARALSTKSLEILCLELVGRTQFYHALGENRRRVYSVLLNAISNLLYRGEERIAAKLIRSVDSLGILESDLIARLQLKLSKAHLQYLQGDPKGLEVMKKLLDVANLLDCYDLSKQIEDEISHLTDMQ